MKANMMKQINIIIIMATALLAAIFATPISAQEFQVETFRELPNDISAFINPVKDLNDEGCALLKVIATSPDFVFTSPLGIAERVNKTGEIWLYLPRGSKKITIKHPVWGVIRDYAFPTKLESHKTYELSIKEPQRDIISSDMKPTVTTIRDTLVLTRVDTVVIKPIKPSIPLETNVLATATIGGKASYLSWGVMASVMKRHGAFIHVSTDFGKTGSISGSCDKNGIIEGAERFYSGETKKKAFMATAGATHRAGRHITIFEGLGYSSCTLAWQLATSEGGGYVKNSYYSYKGLTAEAGIMLKFKQLTISASALTIKGTEWFGSIGIGFRFGKGIKKTTT